MSSNEPFNLPTWRVLNPITPEQYDRFQALFHTMKIKHPGNDLRYGIEFIEAFYKNESGDIFADLAKASDTEAQVMIADHFIAWPTEPAPKYQSPFEDQ